NTTGEDWTKVGLSLVSGRPISFVSQLYAPKYVARPEAELADDTAARPVVHTGAFDMAKSESLPMNGRALAGVAGHAPPPPAAPMMRMEAADAWSRDKVAAGNIAVNTTSRELGDL